MNPNEAFEDLRTADPLLAEEFLGNLTEAQIAVLLPFSEGLIQDIINGLSQETGFGRSIALGYADLARCCGADQIPAYQVQVRKFSRSGPELGKLMAEHLVPILTLKNVPVFSAFLQTIEIMLNKGAYTLYGPLKALDRICEEKDIAGILAYLSLLEKTFSLDLTYKQARPFTYTLPKAAGSFAPSARAFQFRQLTRVIRTDFSLSDHFLEGLSKGLKLLSETALDEFVTNGLGRYDRNPKSCAVFLSLGSRLAQDIFLNLQITVPLSQVRASIQQYGKARTGLSIPLKPLSELPGRFRAASALRPSICSDGKSIYLPDQTDVFKDRIKNIERYKLLARFELGFFEFGSYDFDLEKLQRRIFLYPRAAVGSGLSDLEIFFQSFDDPESALNLFSVFEHARTMELTRRAYPGLFRHMLDLLRGEWDSMEGANSSVNPMARLYQMMVLRVPTDERSRSKPIHQLLQTILQKTTDRFKEDPAVETSAELVCRFYPEFKKRESDSEKWPRFIFPFNRKIYPDLLSTSLRNMDRKALALKNRLEKLGVRVYRSDLRRKMAQNDGAVSSADIQSLILKNETDGNELSPDAQKVDLSAIDWTKIIAESGIVPATVPETTGPAYYYNEWDNRLGDYLHRHTLVHEKSIPRKEDDFYENTLHRYQGLVKKIKYAFEMLKPEELTILRQWVEGDEFDYRALLDFAMDKKAGIMPSDRLYIKRIKQQRDVAVLLLMDLSRSTSNLVVDSDETVLEVEKQAVVLFCEALEVVGDKYAIAGFSGTGRLGVDYFTIKDFNENLNRTVQQRINAIAPQRSTRMGAAIRHATALMEKISSTVRLIIILGDGYPNDVDYKKEYAVSDTRKAILEARSKNIHTHALTVNISGDARLDDLYGNVRHNIISDIRDLPDKLPRIYRSLTRH